MAMDGTKLGNLIFTKLDDAGLVTTDDPDSRDACEDCMAEIGKAIVEHIKNEAEVIGKADDTDAGKEWDVTGDID